MNVHGAFGYLIEKAETLKPIGPSAGLLAQVVRASVAGGLGREAMASAAFPEPIKGHLALGGVLGFRSNLVWGTTLVGSFLHVLTSSSKAFKGTRMVEQIIAFLGRIREIPP